MEIFRWIDEEYSGEALGNREIHQFSHAIPDILETANVQWNRAAYTLDVAPRYAIVASHRDSILAGVVHMIVDEVVDNRLRVLIRVDGNSCRLVVNHRLLEC